MSSAERAIRPESEPEPAPRLEENELIRNIDTLPALLRAQASRMPDQPFVRWRGRTVSYAEFDARTDALAAGLAELGVQPGDVVSVMLPNCLELIEAWWAILKAGAVFGPVNPAFDRARGGVRPRSLAREGDRHRLTRGRHARRPNATRRSYSGCAT